MSLTPDQVRHVATLARVALTEGEVERFALQLSSILGHIAELESLDTTGVEPTSHVLDLANVMRDDQVSRPFPADSWEVNAPSKGHGHFIVPKVIE